MEREKFKWVNCPKCNHKLFKVIGDKQNQLKIELLNTELEKGFKMEDGEIQIKCHSCKNIVKINYS